MDIKIIERDSDGKLPAFAWPGGYPIYYITYECNVVCPACADSIVADKETDCEIVAGDIHWEGEPLECEECFKQIESAYGPVDE